MIPKQLELNEAWPGVYRASSCFDRSLNDLFKQGQYWFDGKKQLGQKAWYVSEESIPAIETGARALGYTVVIAKLPREAQPSGALLDALRPHQSEALSLVLRKRALLFQGGLGVGKTLVSFALHQSVQGKSLVVCPGMVVPGWLEEAAVWDIGKVTEIRASRKIPAEQPEGITVCPYSLLHKLPTEWVWNTITLDELHSVMRKDSRRSQACFELLLRNPNAYRLGLTGTPVSIHMADIWHQLHVLCPHRWGTEYVWTERFHVVDHDGYEGARQVYGLRQDRLAEYFATLDVVVYRVSQAELAKHYPEVFWNKIQVKSQGKPKLPESLKDWKSGAAKEITARVEAIKTLQLDRTQPIMFLTYLHKTANALGEALGIPVITGGMLSHKRFELLRKHQAVVTSMMSIEMGLNLPAYNNIYVLELYPVPRYIDQVLGRFVRIYQKTPVTINVLVLDGSSDVLIIDRLVSRIQEQKQLLGNGFVRDGVNSTLALDPYSDDFLANVREAFANANNAANVDDMEGWLECDDE